MHLLLGDPFWNVGEPNATLDLLAAAPEGTPADLVASKSTLTGEHLAAYVGA